MMSIKHDERKEKKCAEGTTNISDLPMKLMSEKRRIFVTLSGIGGKYAH